MGSGTHAEQTARIMLAFERELRAHPTRDRGRRRRRKLHARAALVAIKERYPVAHVEAGLRCHDPWMAEEINRRLTDHLSTYLFTTSHDADENLAVEGIAPERVHWSATP